MPLPLHRKFAATPRFLPLGIVVGWAALTPAAVLTDPLPDAPFAQETHVPLPRPADAASRPDDLRAVAVGPDGGVWTAGSAGVRVLSPGATDWTSPPGSIGAQPAFALLPGHDRVWVGAWNGLHRGTPERLESLPGVDGPVAALAWIGGDAGAGELLAAGPDGVWRIGRDGAVMRIPVRASRQIRGLAAPSATEFWLATGTGLVRSGVAGTVVHQGPHTGLSCDIRAVLPAGPETVWAAGLGGLWRYEDGALSGTLDTVRGLPCSEVQCLARTRSGELWAGTRRGLARHDGRWSWRHSRRWLLDDDVRGVHLDEGPGATLTAWVATAGGVSRIDRRPTTLEAKARLYQATLEARHIRPPGIVEKCRLRVPGDLGSWQPQDDDNDGGYTAVCLAMESARFAATRDPQAAANARRAFDALRFLLAVTGRPGFIARTVVPSTWTRMADPNEVLSDAAWAAARVDDPRSKRVDERWRWSSDGRWRWKGDTSSDEITAHLFGAFQYHRLAADEAGRHEVRDFVCAIVDHLLAHDYTLTDLDGRPTRWGVWSPERLWNDPDWANEAGINAVEVLSYLKLAHHLSGDPRYAQHYRELLDRHRYRELVPRAKNLNPAGRTHIDDELLAFAWPALLTLETDPDLLALYRDALERWYAAVAPARTPFFEVLYAGLTRRTGALPEVVASLRAQPVDLIRWTVDNARREDIRAVRRPEFEHVQTDRWLPPDERGTPRTDENPWRIVQGDGGHTESDGVFWLLPYWMARQQGMIGSPGAE